MISMKFKTGQEKVRKKEEVILLKERAELVNGIFIALLDAFGGAVTSAVMEWPIVSHNPSRYQ